MVELHTSAQPRVSFPGLSSAAFEHPADRAALVALRRTPGLDRLFKWFSDMGVEKYYRIRYNGDSLRVSPRQCSRLYKDLREACNILDVVEPELYIHQDPAPYAFAFGMQRHTIMMSTGLIDLLDDAERLEVIGEKLGHIKAEHILYTTMAQLLADVIQQAVKQFAIPGAIFSTSLLFAFYAWFRKSELTADRAGLLTVQDVNVCISSHLKLTGGSQRMMDDLNMEEFVNQAELYEDLDDSLLGLMYKIDLMSFRSNPFPAVRAREIKDWSESEQYRRLLQGDYPRANADSSRRDCGTCGAIVTNVTFRYCPDCGQELDSLKAA